MPAPRLQLVVGDITTLRVDAIVNAANESLGGGGGVDGAIHRAAGPELLAACRELGGCPTGEVRRTDAFALPAEHVLHTVGPVWCGGSAGEAELLASCYERCLALAQRLEVSSIAFPAISTGVYGYPRTEAAGVALGVAAGWADANERPEAIVFCCFAEADAAVYRRVADERGVALA